MIKNIIVYLVLLISVFAFNIFYYAWFSWFLLIFTLCIPFLSLFLSLPFMIKNSVNGFVVFGNDSINIGDDFYIGIAENKKGIFCPMVKLKLTVTNNFANEKKKINIIHSGKFNKPLFKKQTAFGKNCGCIDVRPKHCRVYDFAGLFFIPAKINFGFDTYVMPQQQMPHTLPEIDNISILGYKPKSGGGFSDFYELREYRQGDSLKNIHWKLSSKYDDLIVKEPSLPIYKEFTINAIFTDLAKENNNILARLYYICRYIIKKGSPCCATTNKTSYASQLKNDNDIKMFIRYLYKNTSYNSVERNFSHSLTYYIYSNREEVTEE